MVTSKHNVRRIFTLLSLILAGEAIFSLPFHVARFFRPTFLDVFGVDNTQIGFLGSIYGIAAMFSYLLGGGLADRCSARKLLSFSLLATGVWGLYLARIPSFKELIVLFGIWGVTTILPFWAALIRATREWGGPQQQGVAFGVLDGGRGLVAAALASLAVLLFQHRFPADAAVVVSDVQRVAALRAVIYMYTCTCLAASLFVWFVVPEKQPERNERVHSNSRNRLVHVLRMPAIWLQALVIICAYCTYRGIDFYSLYARDAYGLSDVGAAKVSAGCAWVRPVACLGAGLIADRINASRTIMASFALLVVVFASFTASTPTVQTVWILWAHVLVSCVAIFALRAVYFALLEESLIPAEMTGTSVGVVSFIGYTPEIFMPPLAGWLIDRCHPDLVTGHHHLFLLLAGISLVGLIATWILRRIN